eukprot:c36941_g1_i1 orf=361-1206(-)
MSILCKPRLPSVRLGGFCCYLACSPHKPWTHKLTLPPPILQGVGRQRFFCITAQSDNSHHASHNALRDWTSSIGETIKESKHTRHLQIVLFSPQIAGNTGSIARTCAAASVGLHLIEPLGFQIDDAKLKRAGLDYWPFVFVKVHASWSEFMQFFKQQEGEKRLVAFTKRGTCLYTEKEYKAGDWLVFGSETSGLSAEALEDCADELNHGGGKVRIPMLDTYVRSLNLSVSVGIGVYEALRQLNVLRNLFNETNDSLLEDCSEEMSDDKEVDRECLLSAVEQ